MQSALRHCNCGCPRRSCSCMSQRRDRMTNSLDLAALRARLAHLAQLVEDVTEPPAPSQPARTEDDAAPASVPPPAARGPSRLARAVAWLRVTLGVATAGPALVCPRPQAAAPAAARPRTSARKDSRTRSRFMMLRSICRRLDEDGMLSDSSARAQTGGTVCYSFAPRSSQRGTGRARTG